MNNVVKEERQKATEKVGMDCYQFRAFLDDENVTIFSWSLHFQFDKRNFITKQEQEKLYSFFRSPEISVIELSLFSGLPFEKENQLAKILWHSSIIELSLVSVFLPQSSVVLFSKSPLLISLKKLTMISCSSSIKEFNTGFSYSPNDITTQRVPLIDIIRYNKDSTAKTNPIDFFNFYLNIFLKAKSEVLTRHKLLAIFLSKNSMEVKLRLKCFRNVVGLKLSYYKILEERFFRLLAHSLVFKEFVDSSEAVQVLWVKKEWFVPGITVKVENRVPKHFIAGY